jgi:hypothetical protein
MLAIALGAAPGGAATEPEDVLTLTVKGTGEVSIDPPGVVCDSSCRQPLPAGTEVTLVATPGSGSVLASWGGACAGATGDSCELTLDGQTRVTATFATREPPSPGGGGGGSGGPGGGGGGGGGETPTPGATPGQEALDAVLEGLPVGRIAFNTPTALALDETATIHLVLSLEETHAELEERITELGETVGAEIRASDEMEAKLSGADFEIVPLGDERKAVSAQETTEWFWEITPLETGVLRLHVTLSAFVRVAGEERKRELRVFSKQLEIRVGWVDRLGDFVGGNWQWLWTAILVPVSAWLMARRRGGSTPHRA